MDSGGSAKSSEFEGGVGAIADGRIDQPELDES
jgi:hypothetical protein